jgi:CheY-like chemotaxis protein
MKILIADDEMPKLSKIEAFVLEVVPGAEHVYARSVKSAIAAVCTHSPDLVILDMSLPTFDIAPGEPGGRPQGFGGVEILRHMDFHEIRTHVIVVTQYTAFFDKGESVSLDVLSDRMQAEHPGNFRGCVYYGAMNDAWKHQLRDYIEKLV